MSTAARRRWSGVDENVDVFAEGGNDCVGS
jgi:hypothetical protein